MARAEAASASVSSDSIKGLAQSIAKPAYRRLLTAEPALRRAVPALIIAFLVTICVGAFVQVLDHRRQAIAEIVRGMTGSAELLADRLGRSSAARRRPQADRARAADPGLGAGARPADPRDQRGRHHRRGGAASCDPTGDGMTTAVAAARTRPRSAAGSLDVLGPSQPLDYSRGRGRRAGDRRSPTARRPSRRCIGSPPATASSPSCIRRADALAAWRSDTALTVTLSATTGFVVLILGFAFHWQATRAREADVIYETVRSRIDTALNRGRCGLWDWDLARGRIFWSHSMFAILGLEAERRAPELRRGQRAGPSRRPAPLSSSPRSSPTPRPASIDHAFRMRHANGNWVWLRARCELVAAAGRRRRRT